MSNKRNLLVFILIGLLFIALAKTQVDARSAGTENLVGSWSVEASTPTQGAFPVLITFTTDGSVITDESPLPFESSGHGSWVSNTDGEVMYTFLALFGGEDGKNTGKIKVVGTLAFDADTETWSGPFKVEVFDASEQVVFSDLGSFSLTRIQVETLD